MPALHIQFSIYPSLVLKLGISFVISANNERWCMSSRITEELKLLAKAIKAWISASSFGWLPYSSFLVFISRPFFAWNCRMFISHIIRFFTVQAIEIDNLEQQCLEFSNRDHDSKTPRSSQAKPPPFSVREEQLQDYRVSMLSFSLRNLSFL